MHRTCIVPLLILASSLMCASAEASIFCVWSKVMPSAEVHYSFLRRGSASSLRLFHSAWSGGERALRSCGWSDDRAVVQQYLSVCLQRAPDFTDDLDPLFEFRSLWENEEQCVNVLSRRRGRRLGRSAADLTAAEKSPGQDGWSGSRGHSRVKRGFIVPGTLWCGSGNKALSYSDLGVFADTDDCCREHDQCKHTILSFHSQFGVFNRNIFTMSHCECDHKFRNCLRDANDTISDGVGYTFFNLLKMHCFEFSHRLQCTERNWFGMCKESKMALYAEVHPPTLYESRPTGASVNSTSLIISTTAAAEFLQTSTSDELLLSGGVAAASTVPTPLTRSVSTFMTPGANSSLVKDTWRTSQPERTDDVESNEAIQNQTGTQLDAESIGLQLSCGVYKDLDQCKNRILPQQKRHGLLNTGTRTLYHCNCTTRLFKALVKQRQLTKLQALMLGHISPSCFLPQDCASDRSCKAALVSTTLPLLDAKSGAGVDKQRHLQAILRKANSRRTKRKEAGVNLHKLCLRMTRTKQMKQSSRHGPNVQRSVYVQ